MGGILHVRSRVSLESARNEGPNRARCLSFQPSSNKIALSISLVLINHLPKLSRSFRESLSFNFFLSCLQVTRFVSYPERVRDEKSFQDSLAGCWPVD